MPLQDMKVTSPPPARVESNAASVQPTKNYTETRGGDIAAFAVRDGRLTPPCRRPAPPLPVAGSRLKMEFWRGTGGQECCLAMPSLHVYRDEAAAVEDEGVAGNPGAAVGGKVHGRRRHVSGFTQPLQRVGLCDLFAASFFP